MRKKREREIEKEAYELSKFLIDLIMLRTKSVEILTSGKEDIFFFQWQ